MINKYCEELNLNFDIETLPLRKVQESYSDLDKGMIFKIDFDDIDKKLLTLLSSYDLTIEHGEMFYTPPMGSLFIHIDSNIMSNICKLNWVYGGTGSYMNWWQPKDPDAPLDYRTTPIGTRYLHFDRDKCDNVWNAKIGKPSLVNVGVPHSVINRTNEQRWCMSFMLYDTKNNQRLEWDAASKIFNNWKIKKD